MGRVVGDPGVHRGGLDDGAPRGGQATEGVGEPRSVHEELRSQGDGALRNEILALVPDEWLEPDPTRPDPRAPRDAATARELYRDYLVARLHAAERWLP